MEDKLERLCEYRIRVIQAINTLAEEVIGSSIERITEEQGSNIDHFSFPRLIIIPFQIRDEFLDVFFKVLRIDNSVSREHGAD